MGKYKTNLREEILSPLVDAVVFIGYATNDMNQFRQDIWRSGLPGRIKQLVKDKPSGSQDK